MQSVHHQTPHCWIIRNDKIDDKTCNRIASSFLPKSNSFNSWSQVENSNPLGDRVERVLFTKCAAGDNKVPSFLQQQGFVIPSTPSNNSGSSGQSLYLPFRPPVQSAPHGDLSPEEQLEILTDRRGLWHEYAPLVTSLQRLGYTPSMLDEITGMHGVEQNSIVVGTHVYNSLKESGFPQVLLEYFDAGGAETLCELRTLSAEQRKMAAEYVVQEGLDVKGGREVARAIKEYERRKREEGRESFSNTPGDCLAFNYYFQSKEFRNESEKRSTLTKALNCAVTPAAKDKIQEALTSGKKEVSDQDAPSSPVNESRLDTVRLVQDETSFQPVPVLGSLDELSEEILSSERVEAEIQGPFKVFTPEPKTRWTALPCWLTLRNATNAAAIIIPDVTVLPSFTASKKTEALLLVDRDAGLGDLSKDNYFLVASGDKGVAVVDAITVVKEELKALAKVLLVVLPPLPPQPEEMEDWE